MSEARDERFERRTIAWALGLLSDEEADELRSWWEEMQPSGGGVLGAGAADRHVPSALIARWPQVADRLDGLERELVVRHLEHCAACREDLSILRAVAQQAAGEREPAAGAPDAGQRRSRPHRGSARWLPWLGGATLGGALAASLMVLVLRPTAETAPSIRPLEGPLPWVAPSFARGTAASQAAPALGQPLVLVLAVPPGLSISDSLQVEVLDPSGARLARLALASNELAGGSALVQLRPRGAGMRWLSGPYEVWLRAGGQSEVGEFVLRPDSVATKPAQK